MSKKKRHHSPSNNQCNECILKAKLRGKKKFPPSEDRDTGVRCKKKRKK